MYCLRGATYLSSKNTLFHLIWYYVDRLVETVLREARNNHRTLALLVAGGGRMKRTDQCGFLTGLLGMVYFG